jgi:hypothetical protein
VKALTIISERPEKNKDECGKTINPGKLFIWNYLGRIL